ncbi:MAG: NAD(P)-dependent oxidoreductase, partial [Mesorhizobium sp.]
MTARLAYAFIGLGHLGGNLAASLLRHGFAHFRRGQAGDRIAG